MLRAAVVGMGWMGQLHAGIYHQHPRVDLVGLVEPDPAAEQPLRDRFGVPVHRDIAELLDRVDVVSVCTPDHLHPQTTIPFLRAGVRVLVEKPLATSSADAQRILDARPDPHALSVGHILRFDPRVIRARELVRSGELGPLWHVDVWRDTTRTVAVRPSERTSVAWFLGIHDADLVRFVTGLTAVRVAALGRAVLSAHADAVYATVRYEGDVIGSMENNWTLPDGRPNRALAGLRVVGEHGSVEIDLGHVDLLHATADGAVNGDTRNWPSRGASGVSNIRTEVEEFVRAAEEGAPAPVPGEEGLAAVRVVEMIHASLAADGAPVGAGDTR
ncbi:Gfo/Idh/MocA family protein [Micromonospora sp. NPDC049900]|uniref:Gfo/Idh/MocA family protein n=1 Tax=Micromonospora sp. NPDC049900 TaxID=3364275 RepID=UPI00378B7B67